MPAIKTISEFKIFTLGFAHPYYEDIPYELFDFKRMLKREYRTNKEVTPLDNGRPEKAAYSIKDINTGISHIVGYVYFDFSTTSDNVLSSKNVELTYLYPDDTESERIVIDGKDFNLTNPEVLDGAVAMNERTRARRQIIDSMKSFIGGILMLKYNESLAQVITRIDPFWTAFEAEKNKFIHLGTDDWKNIILGLDITHEDYTWMAEFIAVGVNIQDFMVSTLDYD